MGLKTIFLIIFSVLITIVLMKNTDEISFWFFSDIRVSKLAVLGAMFFTGAILGFILGTPKKKIIVQEPVAEIDKEQSVVRHYLTEEDRDYIN